MKQMTAIFQATPTKQQDRFMRIAIISWGILIFLLLAWSHLGLGTRFFPPTASPVQQVRTTGDVTFTLLAPSADLHARHAMLTVTVTAAGHPVTDATLLVHPVMLDMAMELPAKSLAPSADGTYHITADLLMVGRWQIHLTLDRPGLPAQTTDFIVVTQN